MFLYKVEPDFTNFPDLLCDVHILVPHVTKLEAWFYACQRLTTMNTMFGMNEHYNTYYETLDIFRTEFILSQIFHEYFMFLFSAS